MIKSKKTEIIDAVYKRHKINLKQPAFDVATVNEMISDAVDIYASQFPSQGLKWVYLPELPAKRHNYHVKMRTPKNSVIKEYVWNSTCLFDGEKFVDDVNRGELLNGNTVVAWLDESAPSQGLLEEEKQKTMNKKMSDEEYQQYVNRTVDFHGGHVPQQQPKIEPIKAKLIDEIETPEELATQIVNFPNLWGMYSIAEAIRKLIQIPTPDGSQGCDAMGHYGGEPKPNTICPKCNKPFSGSQGLMGTGVIKPELPNNDGDIGDIINGFYKK